MLAALREHLALGAEPQAMHGIEFFVEKFSAQSQPCRGELGKVGLPAVRPEYTLP